MKKWTALSTVAAIAMCELLARSESASAAQRKKIMIGMVAKSQSNTVFQAAYAGPKDAAMELGAKYNADIEINWQTPADEDAHKQSEAIEALTRASVAGIAVSCSEARTVTP